MKGTDLIIAFVLSCAVHTGIFVTASLLQPAEMLYQSGTSAAIYDVDIVSPRSAATEEAPPVIQKEPVISTAPAAPHILKASTRAQHSAAEQKNDSGPSQSGGSYSGVRGPVAVRGLTKPKYPPFAREHGIEGRVVLRAIIAENGAVTEVETLQSSGHDILDSAALKALQEAEFIPGTLDNKPVKSSKVVAFRFSLQDS